MSIFAEPNISCKACGHRHPFTWNCIEAAEFARRTREAAQAIEEYHERQEEPQAPPLTEERVREIVREELGMTKHHYSPRCGCSNCQRWSSGAAGW
jgi:hypothetical protein